MVLAIGHKRRRPQQGHGTHTIEQEHARKELTNPDNPVSVPGKEDPWKKAAWLTFGAVAKAGDVVLFQGPHKLVDALDKLEENTGQRATEALTGPSVLGGAPFSVGDAVKFLEFGVPEIALFKWALKTTINVEDMVAELAKDFETNDFSNAGGIMKKFFKNEAIDSIPILLNKMSAVVGTAGGETAAILEDEVLVAAEEEVSIAVQEVDLVVDSKVANLPSNLSDDAFLQELKTLEDADEFFWPPGSQSLQVENSALQSQLAHVFETDFRSLGHELFNTQVARFNSVLRGVLGDAVVDSYEFEVLKKLFKQYLSSAIDDFAKSLKEEEVPVQTVPTRTRLEPIVPPSRPVSKPPQRPERPVFEPPQRFPSPSRPVSKPPQRPERPVSKPPQRPERPVSKPPQRPERFPERPPFFEPPVLTPVPPPVTRLKPVVPLKKPPRLVLPSSTRREPITERVEQREPITDPTSLLGRPHMGFYARFASAVYQPKGQRTEKLKELFPETWERYHLVYESTYEAVWESQHAVIIAFRGTKVTDTRDLAADLGLILGTENASSRFLDAHKLVKRLRPLILKPIILTGHSLGGSIARDLMQEDLATEAHIFNPGAGIPSPLELVLRLKKEKQPIFTYQVKGDVIAVGGLCPCEHVLYITQTASNPHTLDNFLL